MKLQRRQLLHVAAFTAAFATTSSSPSAQTYPSRPITLVVPYAAGGSTDVVARIFTERMRQKLGQTLLIENVGGANGAIGLIRVARAEPDGYTIVAGALSTTVFNWAIGALPFDVAREFSPVALLPSNPYVIVSKNGLPAGNLKELIAWLKANPGKATAATPGAGSGQHIAGVFFQKLTGTSFGFVPYRGNGPALQDVMAGQVDLMIDQASSVFPYVRSGNIRPYAVTAQTRLPDAPDIPSVDEAGLPGFYISTWFGLWAPKGTPKDAIARLNASVVDAYADPTLRRRITDLGMEVPPPDQQTPEALGALHRAETEKWVPIIKAANIKVE